MRWALVWVILLGVVLTPFLLFEEQFNGYASYLASGGTSAWIAALAIASLLALDLILPVPSSIVSTASGALLGFWAGAAVCWTGMMAGCLIAYAVGARVTGAAGRFVGKDSLEKSAAMMRRHGDWAIALCRPIPVLAEASVLFAGVVRTPFTRFAVLTALANLGISLGYAAIGAFSMQMESFLLAFGGAIVVPGIGFFLMKLWNRGKQTPVVE